MYNPDYRMHGVHCTRGFPWRCGFDLIDVPVEWYFDGDSLNAHFMLGAQENKFQEHSCKNTGSRAGFLGQSKENSFTRLELSRIPKKLWRDRC